MSTTVPPRGPSVPPLGSSATGGFGVLVESPLAERGPRLFLGVRFWATGRAGFTRLPATAALLPRDPLHPLGSLQQFAPVPDERLSRLVIPRLLREAEASHGLLSEPRWRVDPRFLHDHKLLSVVHRARKVPPSLLPDEES